MGRRRAVQGSAATSSAASPHAVPVSSVAHNPRNPRDDYDDIDELAKVIDEVGVLQPIGIVRYETFLTHYPQYEHEVGACDWVVINGNRRLAAARKAGLEDIPAHVVDRLGRDDQFDEAALIENIHRENLPPLREAAALQELVKRHGSQRKVAQRIGKTNGYVSQRIALLNLVPELQAALRAGQINVVDARRLGGLDPEQQRAEWERIQASTPDQEAESDASDAPAAPVPRHKREQPAALKELAGELANVFDTSVKVELGRNKGRIVVEFGSVDELERIMKVVRTSSSG
jgi:ParB family transcriptional regulator, chromosome partitioning protein